MIYGWLISGISASNWFDLIQYNTLANINKKKKETPKTLNCMWDELLCMNTGLRHLKD